MAAAARKSDHSSQSGLLLLQPPCRSCRTSPPDSIITTKATKATTHAEACEPQQIEEGVRDPVCGMLVDPHVTQHRHQHRGSDVLFLLGRLPREIHRRTAEISRASRTTESPPSVPEGTIYTCPMHPQIRQVGPGSCPICGMALEPVIATAQKRAQMPN